LSHVSEADLATLQHQFQQFLQTTLPAALLAANANTQVTIALTRIQPTPKTSEKIVEVLIPLMIPLQRSGAQPTPAASLAGGPEDVGAFLYWLMNWPRKKRGTRKVVLPRKYQRVMRLLQALDAARTLQLARQLGQYS